MRLFVLLIIAVFLTPATAAEYRSRFGYSFQLSSDWLVFTPREVAKLSGDVKAETLGITGVDAAALKATIDKIKTGQVEFYFARKYSTADWTNNISAQMGPPRRISIGELAKQCPTLAAQLQRVYGPSTKVMECGRRVASGVAYLAYEYQVPSEGVTIIQNEIPYGARGTLIIVGCSNREGLEQIRTAQAHIAAMAVEHVKTLQP